MLSLCAGVLTSTASARAQTTGPDVTVGDLPDISNGAPMVVNGISYDSLGLGTICCNKGNQTLNWKNSGTDSRHPVIGQNLFRLQNGRFEQIGQGWLKHAFHSLQGSLCESYLGFACARTTTGNPPVAIGSELPRGCSDTYSSALSNTTGLGPKWQVDASTGLFAFPFAGDAAARGVRVRPSEIGGAGSRYFTEAQYVSADDAAAGNKNNNASWREVGVSGVCCIGSTCSVTVQSACTGTWTMPGTCAGSPCAAAPSGVCCTGTSCTPMSQATCTGTWFSGTCTPSPCLAQGDFALAGIGTVTREQPAIFAWQQADPAVVINTVDVAGDGRFLLACRVTGAGPYTYEYALHNLNSHRCAGSFTVPLTGTQGALSAVGFHDVEYVLEPNALTGAPSSDDWTVSGAGAGSTNLAWSGPAYGGTPAAYTISPTGPQQVIGFTPGTGNDHTANVRRWGTLFNFRFTSSAAPVVGSATIGLWRPGTGTSVAIATLVPGGQPTGACCAGTTCTITTSAGCTGIFQGTPSVCGMTGNPTICCPANYNGVNGLTVQDIFDFLAGFFAADPRADFDHVGGISVQDIFRFLAAWFAGCS
jgi:hypothetical protein